MHADTHDVFVFQTAGSKQWEVHTPDGVEDVLLEPGLSMYLPTGTPHAARAQDTVSLHVTLGINQLTWRGLRRAQRRARCVAEVPDDAPARRLPRRPERPRRRARPTGWRRSPTRSAASTPAAAVEAEVRRFLTGRSPRLAGGLARRPRLGATSTTHPAAPPARPPVRAARPRRPARGAARRPLARRARLAPAGPGRDPARGPSCGPADLAEHLDPQSRLVLCRRLVREGLLEVVA